MPRTLALAAAVALLAAAGPASAQYRQPVPYRPAVNYNGGGWYAGGYPGGAVGGVRYTAPIYSGTPQPYYNGYRSNYGFYVPPVYQPNRYSPGYYSPGYGRYQFNFGN